MHATTNYLQYSVKGTLTNCEDLDMPEIKQKLLHKVVEERDLKLGERIYVDLSSQKKPSY